MYKGKIKRGVSCPNCKSHDFKILFSIKSIDSTYSLIRCRQCELIITTPKPAFKSLYKTYYRSYRAAVGGQRFPLPIDFVMKIWRYLRAHRMAFWARHQPVMDIGCGQATELQILKRRSIPVYGHEYDKNYARRLSRLTNIPISAGDFVKNTYPYRHFQLISLLHSLEHIPNALTVLKKVTYNLKNGGYLLISLPNSESFEARLFGPFWFHLDLPRHIFHFSESFLTTYIEKLGFRKIWRKHIAPEYDFFSLIQSTLNVLFHNQQNLFYTILLHEEEKQLTHFVQLLPQIPFIILIVPLSMVVTPLFWILNLSGTVEMVFKKV